MRSIIMNPWTITVVGGIFVGLVVWGIGAATARRRRDKATAKKEVNRRNSIWIGKKGRLEVEDLHVGDDVAVPSTSTSDSENEIHSEGEIIAGGDVHVGDTVHGKALND